MRKISARVAVTISCLFLLGAAGPDKLRLEHSEVMYKDLTGDGVKEKLVFSYSGPELIHLDVSFRIYRIDPNTKEEKEIFSDAWNTWRIYTDSHGEDYSEAKVRDSITNFLGSLCFDTSSNKRCQFKCTYSLACSTEEIKEGIKFFLQQVEFEKIAGEKKSNTWKKSVPLSEYRKKMDSIAIEQQQVEQIYQEVFQNNKLPCFGYFSVGEDRQVYIWCPSLERFIPTGGCYSGKGGN